MCVCVCVCVFVCVCVCVCSRPAFFLQSKFHFLFTHRREKEEHFFVVFKGYF